MNNCNYLDKTGMESHEVERQFLGSWATADPYVTLYKKGEVIPGMTGRTSFFWQSAASKWNPTRRVLEMPLDEG